MKGNSMTTKEIDGIIHELTRNNSVVYFDHDANEYRSKATSSQHVADYCNALFSQERIEEEAKVTAEELAVRVIHNQRELDMLKETQSETINKLKDKIGRDKSACIVVGDWVVAIKKGDPEARIYPLHKGEQK